MDAKTLKYKVEQSLSILSTIFSFTPFHRMRMEMSDEDTFSSLLLIKKKYCGILIDGSIMTKGISSSEWTDWEL